MRASLAWIGLAWIGLAWIGLAWIGDWLPPALHFALAGKSAETSPGETAMPKLPSLITRLRHSFHSTDRAVDAALNREGR